jgi:adenosine kinase
MDIILAGSIAYDYLMRFPGRFADHILPDKLNTISLSFLVDSMRRILLTAWHYWEESLACLLP